MKKILIAFGFIFLTGLFAGLFFSMALSEKNTASLCGLLLQSLGPSSDFSHVFLYQMAANLFLLAFMIPGGLSRWLSPLPPLALCFKGFSTGFCCGLVYLSTAANPLLVAFVKLLPQNIFFVPAFILASLVLFCSSTGVLEKLSRGGEGVYVRLLRGKRRNYGKRLLIKKGRLSEKENLLLYMLIVVLLLIVFGSFTEALLHQVAL